MLSEIVQALLHERVPNIRTACELGACDGLFLSNTLSLEEAGCDCLCIEANPFYAEKLFENRKKALICGVGTKTGLFDFYQYQSENNRGAAASGLEPRPGFTLDRPPFKIPVFTLEAILGSYDMTNLDFLSLDVESRELDVLKSLGRVRPKAIFVEIINDSTMEIHKLLDVWGYTLKDATNQDAFYVL